MGWLITILIIVVLVVVVLGGAPQALKARHHRAACVIGFVKSTISPGRSAK